jgi:leucyl-tRNA synthetase
MFKFLQRIHRVFHDKEIADACPGKDFQRLMHQTVKKVTHDIENFKFNTAISQMMILVNAMQKLSHIPESGAVKFVKILAPFAPHLAEELWHEVLEQDDTISYAKWPEWDEELTKEDEIELAIQVNGKMRGNVTVAAGVGNDEAIAAAKQNENVQRFLDGKQIVKEIYVPGKIVNVVVR